MFIKNIEELNEIVKEVAEASEKLKSAFQKLQQFQPEIETIEQPQS